MMLCSHGWYACWPARPWCCCYNKSQLFTKQCFTSFPSFVCLSLPLAIRINSRTCFMSFIFTCTHLSLYLASISPPQPSSVAAEGEKKKKKTRLNSKLKSRSLSRQSYFDCRSLNIFSNFAVRGSFPFPRKCFVFHYVLLTLDYKKQRKNNNYHGHEKD